MMTIYTSSDIEHQNAPITYRTDVPLTVIETKNSSQQLFFARSKPFDRNSLSPTQLTPAQKQPDQQHSENDTEHANITSPPKETMLDNTARRDHDATFDTFALTLTDKLTLTEQQAFDLHNILSNFKKRMQQREALLYSGFNASYHHPDGDPQLSEWTIGEQQELEHMFQQELVPILNSQQQATLFQLPEHERSLFGPASVLLKAHLPSDTPPQQ